MNINSSFTPRSMISPLASIGLFTKTKRHDWAFDGRGARSKAVRDTRTSVDIAPSLPLKACRIKFNFKTKTYLFPNGLRITSGMSEVKIVGRRLGYDLLTMGAVKIKL